MGVPDVTAEHFRELMERHILNQGALDNPRGIFSALLKEWDTIHLLVPVELLLGLICIVP